MDISTYKPSDRTIEIVHPGDPAFKIGVAVSLRSINDPAMKAVKRKITDRALYLNARGKAFKADEVEENRNEITYAAMTGWAWGKDDGGDEATFHGEKPDFNRKNVLAVFNELPWFRDQIDEAIGEEKDFFVKSNVN